ncbi:MAG: double zinc ribbon domain-containing protein [Candidatus Brocadiales bacterium]
MMLKELLETTVNLLYPPHCVGCGLSLHRELGPYLCEGCGKGITYIQSPRCLRCGAGLGPYGSSPEEGCEYCNTVRLRFDAAFSAVYFHGAVKELIHQFKYGKKEYLVRPLISIVYRALDAGLPFPGTPYLVIPVPLHRRKKAQRGFNQAELLARHIGRYLEAEVVTRGLSRVRDTCPQTSLGPTQREANVRGAFEVRIPARFSGKTVLLVDDVLTTGLTASECAKVLKRAGAERVYVLTVARSVGPDHGS